MKSYLNHISLGQSLPFDNPHAISVSMPTMSDVIAYEENDINTLNQLQSGYPRFFRNRFVAQLCDYVHLHFNLSDEVEIVPLPHICSLALLETAFNTGIQTVEVCGIHFALLNKKSIDLNALKLFLRQAGIFLSSRQAEKTLFQLGIINKVFQENLSVESNPCHSIRTQLKEAYESTSINDILLCNCGMNAFYTLYKSVQNIGVKRNKNMILQLGNAYLDSFEIMRTNPYHIAIPKLENFAEIEAFLQKNATHLNAVFVELPNNPLLECIDLSRLYSLCQQLDILLLVDSSLASAYTMNLLPFCDVITESLSKFASGQGDLLMGAIIINAKGLYTDLLQQNLTSYIIEPYHTDMLRLAYSIQDYKSRINQISATTTALISYLQQSQEVHKVYSVLQESSRNNFLKLQKFPSAVPGVITVLFKKNLAYYYDKLDIPKGPSFGTIFTLAMPYVYLAHYELVNSNQGQQQLHDMGLHAEMLRISIGLEPLSDLIEVFKKAGI